MKIGILQAGPTPTFLEDEGDYAKQYMRLLDGHGFDFAVHRVFEMQFPKAVTDCDGWLITGSRFGTYEDHAFIPPLEQFIRDAFAAGVPVVGICFGHQIMAQAMGGRVEKFGGGWSVGVTEYQIEGQRQHLNAWHQDQVVVPPPGARTVGHSDFCQHAALAYGNTGFSVQPHPEFDHDFVNGLIEHRGRGVVPDPLLDAARQKLGASLDQPTMANRIAQVFKQAHAARAA